MNMKGGGRTTLLSQAVIFWIFFILFWDFYSLRAWAKFRGGAALFAYIIN